MAIKTKHRTLTVQDIYDLFNTNIIALAAPPAGYVNRILGVTHKKIYGGSPYVESINIYYGETSGGLNAIYTDDFSTSDANDYNRTLEMPSVMTPVFCTVDDFVISASATTTMGNSVIQSYLTYETVLLNT